MQSAETGYDLVLDPAAYQDIHLIESDGIPMDTPWHWYCLGLLIFTVLHYCRGRKDFYTGGNMFMYFNPHQARNLDYRGPDFFYIKDGVQLDKPRLYWAVWEENGRCPDVIVELLWPTTEREDRTTKFRIYEQTLRTPEYFLYDPNKKQLEGWRLIGSSYVPLQANDRGWLWSAELGLWLGTWVGHYRIMTTTWLRMYTATGELVPLPEEAERQRADEAKRRADEAKRSADEAKRRADEAKRRADEAGEELTRLRALLQQQPPPKINGTQPS